MGMSAPKDNSAELARQAEEQRKADIALGMENINREFAGFDDPYFAQSSSYYTDFYQPELQKQYNDAMRKVVADLYRTGNIRSTAGAEALGDFQERLAQETSQITGRASDFANSRRQQVEDARSGLISQLNATADPAAANAAAIAQAQALNRMPTLSPLGNVFGDLMQSVGTGLAAEKQGYRGMNSGLFEQPKNNFKLVG